MRLIFSALFICGFGSKIKVDPLEREVGGGIGMGNTCKPMAVSFQCMTKFTTNKKKKLILKQHGFELCRSTYIEFFSDTL